MYFYFTTAGVLNVVAPPGISPTVSGASNYHVVRVNQSGIGASYGPSSYNSYPSATVGAPSFPTSGADYLYFIDPIVSSSSSCGTTTSLFGPVERGTE